MTEKVWESDSTDASEAEEPKAAVPKDKPAAAGKAAAEPKTKKPVRQCRFILFRFFYYLL